MVIDGVKVINQAVTDRYALYNGDSCEILKGIPDNSIHYEIFSPPFASLYTYSNSERDLGNCKDTAEFYEQYKYIIKELYRVLMPGRLVSFHCMDLPLSKERDGVIGLRDFRGEMIKLFQDYGFILHSQVCIWKDPVTAMQRTKALGLLHKQIKKDSCMSRQGIPDYLVTMRKPGENPERVTHTNESFPVSVWQRYASPVWMDINPSDTLQASSAKEDKDERHICFAAGTLVLTKRGYIPIESVCAGEDEVLTNSGNWHRVVAKAKTAENAEVVRVNATGVAKLVCTKDHEIMAKRGYGTSPKENICRVNELWTQADKLDGCYVKSVMPPETESNISEQEWWIIGRWCADGHVDVRGKQFFVSVGNDKWEEFCNMAHGHIGHVSEHGNCKQVGLVNISCEARDVLKKIGKGAANKVMPVECISLNKELSSALFAGYKSGDGHTTKSGKIMFTSASRSLLLGMAIVAQKALGVIPSVYMGREKRKAYIQGREVNCNEEWIMTISPKYCFGLIENDATWKRVKRIVNCGTSDVWSIEVETDHSYMVEGCVAKNCPLQLGVIRRAINLWTNPNDTVLTPFLGIGSEAVVALEHGRKAVGIELKKSYYDQAVRNCEGTQEFEQITL